MSLGSSALWAKEAFLRVLDPGPWGGSVPHETVTQTSTATVNYLPASPLAGHLSATASSLCLPYLRLTHPSLLPSLAAARRQKLCQRGALEAKLHLLGGLGLERCANPLRDVWQEIRGRESEGGNPHGGVGLALGSNSPQRSGWGPAGNAWAPELQR